MAAAGGTLLDSPLAAVGVAMVRPERDDFAGRVEGDEDVAAAWRPTLVGYHHPERGPKGDKRPGPPPEGRRPR